jgi:DNA-binding MarR family transcriptional regulator
VPPGERDERDQRHERDGRDEGRGEAPHWLDAEEMRVWQAFLAAGALVGRRVEQQLKEQAGLSHVQYEVLVRLSGAENGELRMTELADSLLTSKSGLSYQIGRLEQAGLVRRRMCESDVRGVYAVLTDAGRAKLAEVAPGHVATVREYVVDRLGRGRLTLLAEALEQLADRAAETEWRTRPG